MFRVFNFGSSPNDSSSSRPAAQKFFVLSLDFLALLTQLSGALAWPILQWMNYSSAEAKLISSWALPAGMLLKELALREASEARALRTSVAGAEDDHFAWRQPATEAA